MGKKSKSKTTKTKKETLGAKGFSEALPEVAKGLRAGTVDPERLANEMAGDAFLERVGGGKAEQVNPEGHVVTSLAQLACAGASVTLVLLFTLDYFKRWESQVFAEEEPNLFVDLCKNLFVEMCNKWKHRIEEETGKPIEETCPLYSASPEEFRAVLWVLLFGKTTTVDVPKVREIFSELKKSEQHACDIWASAKGVQAGIDRLRWQCWECGLEGEEKLKCGNCEAARYCSTICQTKAWKSGHREACSNLKTAYERHQADYRRIDSALKNKAVVKGCPLKACAPLDYQLMKFLTVRAEGNKHLAASMDSMYCNIAKVVNGGQHWALKGKFSFANNWQILANRPSPQIPSQGQEYDHFTTTQLVLSFETNKKYVSRTMSTF